VHEVYIDDEQMIWFEQLLQQYQDRPVVVFTHAPPMGSGLKVVQNVHVKNRCAWLNHSDRPERFMQLVQKYGNVRLWFSGHFHLSQNYPDSISVVGKCAFVQTGVIGECNRDGNR
jgi:3',5'-cyclic AMP phosphodiesterase CpdA